MKPFRMRQILCATLMIAVLAAMLPGQAFTPIRIACGNVSGFTDGAGNVWGADDNSVGVYSSGSTGTFSTTDPIANTADDPLYQKNRYWGGSGTTGSYTFALANGTYTVRVKIAEVFYEGGAGNIGLRNFNITIEGVLVETGFDAIAAAPGNVNKYAHDLVYTDIVVSDGNLVIQFGGGAGSEDPNVSAIEITAAQPSITDVATSDLDYTSVRATFTTSPAAFTRILYGIASDNLAYATNSDGGDATLGNAQTAHAFQLTGLRSATTYWYSIEARPTSAHDCVATPTPCTVSTPASFTTSAETATSRLPTLPSAWVPSYPDTTGYYTVPVVRSGTHGDCVASAEVSGTDGTNGWTVTAGMPMQTIIETVRFGTIIEVPQGVDCDVRSFEAVRWANYLTYKAVDPRASNVNDPAHPWVIIRTARSNAGDFPPYGSQTGPAYYAKMARFRTSKHKYTANSFVVANDPPNEPHHYWLDNFVIAPDPAGYNAGDSSDGPPWVNLMCIGCSSGATFGRYVVMDRLYLEADSPLGSGQAAHCTYRALYLGGSYLAVIGSYIAVDCPEGPGGPGNSSPGSMSVGIEIKEGSPGPFTLHNNHIKAIGMGTYFETQGATVVATNVSDRRNTYYQPTSTLRPPDDALYTSDWDGISRHFRQLWESKGSRNVLIDGNYFYGAYAAQNEGPVILFTANTNGLTGVTGNKDYTITNNLFRKAANLLNCASVRVGDAPPGGPDVAPMTRILFANNLAFDMGRAKYSKRAAGAGVWNGQISLGCTDMVIRRNTLGWATNVDVNTARMSSGTFFTGLGMQPMTGLRVEDNIFHVNSGDVGATVGIYRQTSAVKGTHPPIPNVVGNSTPKAAIDSMYGYLNGSGGVTPDYFWRGNIIVAGTGAAFGNYTLDDLDQTEVNTLKSTYTMPGDGNDIWMAGANRGARAAAAGITDNFSVPSYRVTPTASHSGHAGANIDQIRAAHGIVSQISVAPTAAGARFSYIAPDEKTCAVDVNTTGTTWVRTTDAGGGRRRHTIVSGLSASTAYPWRLTCYRLQAASVPYDFLASHEVTNGTFTTAASGTRVISVGFTLPSGATQARITATPAGGSQVQQTCTVSPCSLTLGARGAYTRVIEYLSAGDAVLRTSDVTYLQAP